MYRRYNAKRLGDYNDVHNFIDAMQLRDIEENFAMNPHARFKLDLSSFVTLP